MTSIDELVNRNRSQPQSQRGVPSAPGMAVALVLCMDVRVDSQLAFGLAPGEAHVIRNAGGVVTEDVLRSLAISQHALGTVEVMIVQHTDCGLARLEEDGFRQQLADFAGFRPTWAVQAFKDPRESVRESVRRVRQSPFLQRTDGVRGFVFDVESGLVEEVTVD